jgi:hypothetical protein
LDNLGNGVENNYLQKNINMSMSNESKKDINKKIITDDIEDFYYDEDQSDLNIKINKDKKQTNNTNNIIDINAAGYSKRSTRNKDTNIYKEIDLNASDISKINFNPKVKKI